MSSLQRVRATIGSPRANTGSAVTTSRQPSRRSASERAGEKGFVKRDEGFDQVLAKAKTFRGTHHAKIVILAAVRTMPGLTPAERQVLQEAVDIIPREEFTSPDEGIVYPRNHVMAGRCSLTMERVKVAKRGLERKGLAIRHIAGDNNSSHLDIRPFLAEIDQHIAYRVALDEARHAADDVGDSFSTIERIENIPRGVDSDLHIQSRRTASGSLVPADAGQKDSAAKAAERSFEENDASRSPSSGRRPAVAGASCAAEERPNGPKHGQARKCSPRGASVAGRASFTAPVDPKQAQEQLLRAYELSSRWRDVVDIVDVQQLAYDRLFAATAEMVRKYYPDPRRNHDRTWAWAVSHHHWRAILMAIIAIEDPNVRNPGAYLGQLVKAGDRMDLSLNLGWIAAHRERQAEQLDELEEGGDDKAAEVGDGPGRADDDQVEQLVEQQAGAPIGGEVEARPGGDDQPQVDLIAQWPLFLQALAGVLRKGEFDRWRCGDLRPEGVSGQGDLVISMPSSLSADWIQQHYSHQLRLAVDRMRWRFRAVRVRARS